MGFIVAKKASRFLPFICDSIDDVQLTRYQIDAIAHCEHEWVESRGHIKDITIERVMHEFICMKLCGCVCMNPDEMRSLNVV